MKRDRGTLCVSRLSAPPLVVSTSLVTVAFPLLPAVSFAALVPLLFLMASSKPGKKAQQKKKAAETPNVAKQPRAPRTKKIPGPSSRVLRNQAVSIFPVVLFLFLRTLGAVPTAWHQ